MTVVPGTPPLLRMLNDRAVLSAVLDAGPLTVADLVARTGLSKPTVSQGARRLLEGGLLADAGSVPGRSGPAAARFGPGDDLGVAVGLEVRRGRITGVAIDVDGSERARSSRRATENGAPAQVLATLTELGVAGRVRSLAVAVPGTYDRVADRVRYANRMTGWMGEGLAAALAEHLPGAVVEVENDAKLVAVAEHTVGAGRGCACLALLYSGTGLAAAGVVDGVLHRGVGGAAGEIGYLVGVAGPGKVQDRLGPKAVLDLGREHDFHFAEAAELVQHLAATPSPAAEAVLAELGVRYAGLASVIASVIDPERLVLSGPLLEAGGEPLRERIAAAMEGDVLRAVPLVPAQVPDAALTGAVLRAVAGRRLRALDLVGTLGGGG